ncbi:cadherin-like beta sandwich domain-containing protein [Cohnella panacarvi]|uniref:cadherin-like beta sandwich domain-containing protein n=1 Tax=Cohnella panacarvi TaxID=400776 RepID=UPI00047ED93D|nr:cadherin-like beta sandwich domain-containing protein [Cohnella panacarvi]
MKRKILVVWLAILVVAVPLLGSFSTEAAAASTRVAVIKELKGSVKVKKAGGSKEFTAFAKMSLNEGDVMAVGSGGSAVLQFANGTSEDDKMTVASNTKLTFSKLSNKKGTTTKVSMWSGSAWVDVKSITNKEDQFTLETPTAVMGVRGTHLLVTVNPNTGATNLMVAAGVVQTTPTAGSGQAQSVYPTQNALITNDGTDDSDITIAPADLEALMKQGNAEIVKAIIQGAADITAENEQYVQRYENGEMPEEIGGSSADLERFKNNTQNLLGALATQAVQTGLITQERMNQLIEEAGNQSGYKVDLTKRSLQLTEAEKAKQEAQRKKEEEVAKRTAERKVQEEAERKKLEETLRKVEEARKAQQKANEEAAENAKKKAKEAYEKQLSDAEKARFKSDETQRQNEIKSGQSGVSPSPSPTPSPSSGSPGGGTSLSSNANLSGLTVSETGSSQNLIVFEQSKNTYTVGVANTTGSVVVKPAVEQPNAKVKVNGQAVGAGTGASVTLASSGTSEGTTTTIPIIVTAQNGTTKSYTVVVDRQASLLTGTVAGIKGFRPDQGVYTFSVANDTTLLPLNFGQPSGVNVFVSNNGESVYAVENGTFMVPLRPGSNTITVTVTHAVLAASISDMSMLGVISSGLPQTYTLNVTREASASTTAILSFDVGESQSRPAIINAADRIVDIEVHEESSLHDLIATFELSPGAKAYTRIGENDWDERASGELQSFYGPVVYRISAEDGMFTDWLVYVHYPYEFHGIGIGYGGEGYLSALPIGNNEYVAHVNTDLDAYEFTIHPYGIYLMNDVYQLVDGERVRLENGLAQLPVEDETGKLVEGWYDFIVSVGGGDGERTEYELHFRVGDGVPEPFEGFSVITANAEVSGEAYFDPTSLFVEIGEYGEDIQFKPHSLPEGVQLDAMLLSSYGDTLEVLQPHNGYYSVNAERFGYQVIAALSSEGMKWAYTILFMPDSDPDLYNVALFSMSDDEYVNFGNIDIDESGNGSFNVPEELLHQDIYVLPQFNSNAPFTRVEINGKTFEPFVEPKYRLAEFSGEMTIPISITSPSGKFTHAYTIDLGVAEAELPAPPQLASAKIYNMDTWAYLPITINDLMNVAYDPSMLNLTTPPSLDLGLELAPEIGQSVEVYQDDEQIFPTDGKYLFPYYGSNVSFNIVVTSADGESSKEYPFVVSPYPINNAGINNLMVGNYYYVLYSAVASADYYYVIPKVEGEPEQFALNDVSFGIAPNASVTVKLNGSTEGVEYDDQAHNYDFVLNNVDSNLITIEVTAEAGNIETYNLYVVKNHSPHNLVLNNIILRSQNSLYTSSGYYSNVTNSYWLSPYSNLDKEVESVSLELQYGTGSDGVHSRVYASDGTELTANVHGYYEHHNLHFGHNSFYIDVFEPQDQYYQQHLYNFWRDGQIEVWDGDGATLLSSKSYTASSNIELTVPFDTTGLKFRTDLNSPGTIIKAKYIVGVNEYGENEYEEISVFDDESYSDEFTFTHSADTIVLEIYPPYTQYYTYTIHLAREVIESEPIALLGDASLSWGLSYNEAELIPTGFTRDNNQTSFNFPLIDVNEAVTLRLTKHDESSGIDFVELNGNTVTGSVYGAGIEDYPLNLKVGSNHIVVRLSVGDIDQTYDFYMDALPSHIEGITSSVGQEPIEWHYGWADELNAEIEYGQTQILLGITAEQGYTVEFSGNLDYDAVSGTWSNLNAGLNTLIVHVSDGSGWSKEFTLNLTVGGSA